MTSLEGRLAAYDVASGAKLWELATLDGATWKAHDVYSVVPCRVAVTSCSPRGRRRQARFVRRRTADGLLEPLALPADGAVWSLSSDGRGNPVAVRADGLCNALNMFNAPALVQAGYIEGLGVGPLRSLGAPITYGCGILNVTSGALGTTTVTSVRENLLGLAGVVLCAPDFNSAYGSGAPAALCATGNAASAPAPCAPWPRSISSAVH